jgi:hypothetical protein
MKTVGIMQPYLFPYTGYFQLIRACDVFVWLDDVQYIKRGWINTNRILLGGAAHDFVFSVRHAAQELSINQRSYSEDFPREAAKFLKTLHMAYHKAPGYEPVRELIVRLLSTDERNVAEVNIDALEAVCGYTEIAPAFHRSSRIPGLSGLHGAERIMGIVKALEGTRYVNAIGGTTLYSFDRFGEEGIELKFLKRGDATYPQTGSTFIPNLSIVDLLMSVEPGSTGDLLADYRLLGEGELHAVVA